MFDPWLLTANLTANEGDLTLVEDYFGPAWTQYTDWRGTAAGDEADVNYDINDAVGLDKDRWWIVDIELYGSEGGHSTAAVLAADKRTIAGYNDAERVATENDGAIPVQRFRISAERSAELIFPIMFKRWAIRFVYDPAIASRGYRLVEQGDEVAI